MLTIDNAAAKAAEFIETIPPYRGTYAGCGIVICAGGPRYLTCAWVAIKALRHVGCQLPIEVWYLGDNEGDPEWIELVEPLGVMCVDALQVAKRYPHPRLGGWESKAYAILHSRFKEVLLLDADNVPTVDPTYLFADDQYLATGAIFWPDCCRTPADSPRWRIFGVPFRDEPEQESGQVLIDKSRCWRALQLCNWYNEHSSFFYQHVYGDKDTFLLAWRKTGQPYAMPPRGPETIPNTLCQFDFDGRRLFQHRIHDKWSLLGNTPCEGFLHEAECLAFVRELGEQWSPVGFVTRKLSEDERERMAEISKPNYRFVHVGLRGRAMQLARSGCILAGSSREEAYWWFRNGEVALLDAGGKPTYSLSPQTDGSWLGHALHNGGQMVRLVRLRR
jgi:hypothetical protein